ncbi:MAG: hypothetical protein ABJD11_04895 [Gemmatimonadota bacterium]
MKIRGKLRILFGVAAFCCLACGSEDTSGPAPGALRVMLHTPNADDGALLLTVSGGPIDTVESAGFSTSVARMSSTSFRVLIAGDIGNGNILTLQVPDRHAVTSYVATVTQAASRSTFLLQNPTGYSLLVQP